MKTYWLDLVLGTTHISLLEDVSTQDINDFMKVWAKRRPHSTIRIHSYKFGRPSEVQYEGEARHFQDIIEE